MAESIQAPATNQPKRKKYVICEHAKARGDCKICSVHLFCEHGAQTKNCVACHGQSICAHGKRKRTCKECKGAGICEHEQLRSTCRDCNGSQICAHDKIKTYCHHCATTVFCEHDRERRRCKECLKTGTGGWGLCSHGLQPAMCKECGGKSICVHNKQRSKCKVCGGSELCKTPMCEVRAIRKYNNYCLRCCIYMCPEIKVARNYKTKECTVVDFVRGEFPHANWVHNRAITSGCSQRRPDLLLDNGHYAIIVEIDENKHTAYDCACENKRIMEISRDMNHIPIVLIRFNPDAYVDGAGVRHPSCWRAHGDGLPTVFHVGKWTARLATLRDTIAHWLTVTPDKTVEIIELFY